MCDAQLVPGESCATTLCVFQCWNEHRSSAAGVYENKTPMQIRKTRSGTNLHRRVLFGEVLPRTSDAEQSGGLFCVLFPSCGGSAAGNGIHSHRPYTRRRTCGDTPGPFLRTSSARLYEGLGPRLHPVVAELEVCNSEAAALQAGAVEDDFFEGFAAVAELEGEKGDLLGHEI